MLLKKKENKFVLRKGRKHRAKKISFFLMFSICLFFKVVKSWDCMGKCSRHTHHMAYGDKSNVIPFHIKFSEADSVGHRLLGFPYSLLLLASINAL